MKYAFVMGSNAFIVPDPSIYYGKDDSQTVFLRINSIYHDTANAGESSFLDVDLNIKDTDGTPVIIVNNKPVTGAPYTIKHERDSLKVFRSDGSMIINVQQMSDEAALNLEHNITAELEINAPIAVIRVSGEFHIDALRIGAENEKLYINDNGYATSAMTGHGKLVFTSAGVVI